MKIYTIFQYLLMFGSFFFVGYPFVLGIFALFVQPKQVSLTAFNHSFLIVVHCRNKDQEISKTLYSITGLVYPWNLFDIIVVASDCTDGTVKFCKKVGARIIEYIPSEQNGADNTLQDALKQVEEPNEKYDAVVLVTPNDLISGNFLKIMNHYLEEGNVIIQSARRKISDLSNWKAKYLRLCWLLPAFINALGRKKLGLKAILLGSGMCFRTEALEQYPIKLSQPDEDFNTSILPRKNALPVEFAPEAVIWSPLDESGFGRFPWKYLSTIFDEEKEDRRIDLLIWTIPILLILMLVVTGGDLILNVVLWKLGFISARFWMIWMILTGMVIIYLSIGVAADRNSSPELSSLSNENYNSDSGNRVSYGR